MTRKITAFVFICLCHASAAQVNLVPYVGLNSTKIYDGLLYANGGAFAVTGIEVELARNPKQHNHIYLSVATGASFLNNGFYYSGNFSYTALNFYTQRTTDLKTRYIQIPLTVRLNWQPFPLVEDWRIFLGVGACHSTLTRFTLQETYTEVQMNDDFLATPIVTSYADSRDVIGYGKKNSVVSRIELGMKYKRLQLCYRLSKSLTDLYRTGLENDWNVPDDKSWYIDADQDAGKIIEKYSELAVGFRFGRGRN